MQKSKIVRHTLGGPPILFENCTGPRSFQLKNSSYHALKSAMKVCWTNPAAATAPFETSVAQEGSFLWHPKLGVDSADSTYHAGLSAKDSTMPGCKYKSFSTLLILPKSILHVALSALPVIACSGDHRHHLDTLLPPSIVSIG